MSMSEKIAGKYKHIVFVNRFPDKLPHKEVAVFIVSDKLSEMIESIDKPNILLSIDDISAAVIKVEGWQGLELLAPCRAWVLDHSRNVIQRVILTNTLAVSLETASNEIRWGVVVIGGRAENVQKVALSDLFPRLEVSPRSIEVIEDWVFIANSDRLGLLGINFVQEQIFSLKLLAETRDRCTSINVARDLLLLGCGGRLYTLSVEALLDLLDKLPSEPGKWSKMSIPESRGLGKFLEFREVIGPSVLWEPSIRRDRNVSERTKETPLPWGAVIDAFPTDEDTSAIIVRTTYWVAMFFPGENLLVPIVPTGLPPFVFPAGDNWVEIYTENINWCSLVRNQCSELI